MMSRLGGLWRTHRVAVLVVCALAAAAIAGAFIWPVTDLIAAHDVGTVSGPLRASSLQTAREAVRAQLLTLGAGLFAAGALVYTARNFTLSREGQVTDRYTKAIEQLGSDKLDVRIGSIYALERVANDSPRDHPTVMEVLAAFVREHSREQWTPAESGTATPERRTRPDVQAAATVIGRRNRARDIRGIDLTRADLARANLARADLTDATFINANLANANLTDANLTSAYLTSANLSGATLVKANLTSAILPDANLSGANLSDAILMGAWLPGADLSHARLSDANLNSANLSGADLSGVDLFGAKVAGADFNWTIFSEGRPVPDGWVLDRDEGRLINADEEAGDAGN